MNHDVGDTRNGDSKNLPPTFFVIEIDARKRWIPFPTNSFLQLFLTVNNWLRFWIFFNYLLSLELLKGSVNVFVLYVLRFFSEDYGFFKVKVFHGWNVLHRMFDELKMSHFFIKIPYSISFTMWKILIRCCL